MIVITVDVLDGRGLIEIAVENYTDAERIREFLQDAKEAIEGMSATEEADYLAELNRGYAKDRI
jgi:hypothetical protein